MTNKTDPSIPPKDTTRREAKSRFARFIDTAYGMDTWFHYGGLAFILLVLLTQDEFRHALMRALFDR